MNGKLLQSKFIKPFSKGQITLPKDYREYLGINDTSWLKLFLFDNKIIVQPVKEEKPKISLKDYLKMLPKIKGTFGVELEKENKQIRKELEDRLIKSQF